MYCMYCIYVWTSDDTKAADSRDMAVYNLLRENLGLLLSSNPAAAMLGVGKCGGPPVDDRIHETADYQEQT